jgi:hypothetical protein
MRCLLHPPSQQTCQSPKREPSVTGVRRRRYFVSRSMADRGGQHIHGSTLRPSQVGDGRELVRSCDAPAIDLLETHFARRPNPWLGKLVGGVSRRWMINLGSPAFAAQSSGGFGPSRRVRALLHPMDNSCLITPIRELAHHASMNAGNHEGFHCCLARPDSGRPERVARIAEQASREITFCCSSLASRSQRLQKENWEIAPGAYAETGNRNQRHVCFPLELLSALIRRGH